MSQPAASLQIIGTQQNPIAVLDEQQQKKFYDHLLELSRNEEIIKKALLCKTSIDIVFAIIMTKFPGEIIHKENCLKQELAQYFYSKTKVNILYQYFSSRLEPDYSSEETKPFAIGLIVHGVDFMETRQIGKMFSTPIEGAKGYIRKITWINDSNVQIVFFNPQLTQAVVERLTANIPKDNVKIEEEASTELPRGWFQLNSYNIYGIDRKLHARYATTLEVDIKRTSEVNRYTIFQNAQKGLELYLLTKFQAIEDFQNIMKQIQYENYRKSVLGQSRYFHSLKPIGNQDKFNQYMAEGKKQLNLQLNFQPKPTPIKPIPQKSTKPPATIEITQSNELNVSYICSTDKNGQNIHNQNQNLNTSIIEPSRENAMVNEAEDNVVLNSSILAEINQIQPEPMVNEDVQVQHIMVEESEQPKVEQQPQALKSVVVEEKKPIASDSENFMNLFKKISEISATNNEDKTYQITPENMKLLLKHFTVKDGNDQNAIVPEKPKEIIKSNPPPLNSNPPPLNSNPPPLNNNPPPFNNNPPPFNKNPPSTIQPKPQQPVAKETAQEKPKNSGLEDYQPFLLNLAPKNEKSATSAATATVKEQKKDVPVDIKDKNSNPGNNNTQRFPQDKPQPQQNRNDRKETNPRNDGNSKGKPYNQGSGYQKSQNKASLPDDQFYEPSSY